MHIVLDLDETLIHTTNEGKYYDFAFTIGGTKFYGLKRPGLDLFLKYIFKEFDTVSIWTAATRDYAKMIVKNIFTNEQISKILFLRTRKDLHKSNGSIYKPLKNLFQTEKAIQQNMNPLNTIMIDDREDVLMDNPGNGILIPAFKGNKDDKYLVKLIIILDGIKHYNMSFGHFQNVLHLANLVD